jgi:hypothetical protein
MPPQNFLGSWRCYIHILRSCSISNRRKHLQILKKRALLQLQEYFEPGRLALKSPKSGKERFIAHTSCHGAGILTPQTPFKMTWLGQVYSEQLLFAWGVRGSTYVQVAQVVERGFLVIAHAAGKVGVAQTLIARGFRHVLQHA